MLLKSIKDFFKTRNGTSITEVDIPVSAAIGNNAFPDVNYTFHSKDAILTVDKELVSRGILDIITNLYSLYKKPNDK